MISAKVGFAGSKRLLAPLAQRKGAFPCMDPHREFTGAEAYPDRRG